MSEDDDYEWLSDATGSDSGDTKESKIESTDPSQGENRAGQQNATTLAAESIQNNRNIESEQIKNLCEVLSNPSSSQGQIKNQLNGLIDEIESGAEIQTKIDNINKSTSTRELESIREEVVHTNTDTGRSISDLLNLLVELNEEIEEKEEDMNDYKDAVLEVSDLLDNDCQRVFRGTESVEILEEFSEAVNNEELIIQKKEATVRHIIEDIEYDIDLETHNSRKLVESLKNPENSDAKNNILSSLETIDELSNIKNTVDEINRDDLLRRVESVKSDLELKDTPVYRHLEDRIRELEVMVNDRKTEPMQKYAIYQEITFYDRTLIPRLSRSMNPNQVDDIDREINKVENRISQIKNDYVSVRADHNHSIPNHFITLTEDLCAQSRQLSDDNADIAAGIITSSDKLLDYIEELYEKNEYSVMLRRLRG